MAALGTVMFTGSGCGEELGTLTQWSSVSKDIGRWGETTSSIPTLTLKKLNSNASFFFTQGFTAARNQWNAALGSSISQTSVTADKISSSAKLGFYGGTRVQLKELKIFDDSDIDILNSGAVYLKSPQSTVTKEGIWKHNGNKKTGYLLESIRGFIIDYGYTEAGQGLICTHELGHALGFFGHSDRLPDMMYPRYEDGMSFTLTDRDKKHVHQMHHR